MARLPLCPDGATERAKPTKSKATCQFLVAQTQAGGRIQEGPARRCPCAQPVKPGLVFLVRAGLTAAAFTLVVT